MPHSVWEWMLGLVAVGFPWYLARRHSVVQLATLTALFNLLWVCAFVLILPDAEAAETATAAIGLLAIDLAAWFAPEPLARRVITMVRWPSAKIALTVATALLAPLGLAEVSCRLLCCLHVLRYQHPVVTVWRSGPDDWRLATITGDRHREPDPVLLWRPTPHRPFNAQRFKGPIAERPKPPGRIRVMCYGDSLTDGPPEGDWPSRLQALTDRRPPFPGRRVEVINAGVAGYSSHQGLLRFLQDVDRYEPDLLLVSFGWNDAAEAAGQPDRSFRIPPWPMVVCQRALIRYSAYLVMMYYTRAWRAQPQAAPAGEGRPRVSIEEYLANLERFRREAEARGIPAVFLTRPHRLPPADLRGDPTWRRTVPDYNAAMAGWARETGARLVDAQAAFERLPSALFADECHFTPRGYQRMAELMADRLLDGVDAPLRLARDRAHAGPTSGRLARAGS